MRMSPDRPPKPSGRAVEVAEAMLAECRRRECFGCVACDTAKDVLEAAS